LLKFLSSVVFGPTTPHAVRLVFWNHFDWLGMTMADDQERMQKKRKKEQHIPQP
jgi:hypothetical protein